MMVFVENCCPLKLWKKKFENAYIIKNSCNSLQNMLHIEIITRKKTLKKLKQLHKQYIAGLVPSCVLKDCLVLRESSLTFLWLPIKNKKTTTRKTEKKPVLKTRWCPKIQKTG